jgi:hypothetical protein
MAAAKKKAAAPKTANLPVNIREQLEKEAADIAKRVQAPTGDFIQVTQDKQFILPDGTKSTGPLSVVILDFVSAKRYSDRPYKKGEESPPACFALGLEPNSLKAHPTSPDKQGDDCNSCPLNQWGSDGKGKACKDQRILAVTAPGTDDVYRIKVSPTGCKPFDAYVGTVRTQYNTPPIGVVTEIYFDPNVSHASLRFGNPRPNTELEKHFGLKDAARERLLTPPDVSSYEPLSKGKSAGKRK